MKKVIVVGGGAAGMMAAIAAGRAHHEVILLEKNEKLGKKIYITGKGRCNFTNACDINEFFDAVPKNPKFLYSAVYGFTNHDMIDLIESCGVKTKVERGGRVFPVSDHASDITKALEAAMKDAGVKVYLHTKVKGILMKYSGEDKKAVGVVTAEGDELPADAVIIATGGLSYQTTGSTGDGHKMLSLMGIKVNECFPSLVQLKTKEKDTHELSGLSLKNVSLSIGSGKKKLYDGFGELLFTHEGISGPLALSASSYLTDKLSLEKYKDGVTAHIDLKPALDAEKLYERICRDIEESPKRELTHLMYGLMPKSLAEVLIGRLSIDRKKHLCDITKDERRAIAALIKDVTLLVYATGDFKEAIITRGGVDVKEIDPSTMRVRSTEGLFVAGELIDVDALTGGYNLQIAFSTGYLAGSSI